MEQRDKALEAEPSRSADAQGVDDGVNANAARAYRDNALKAAPSRGADDDDRGGGGGARRCTARTTTSDGAFEAASQNTTIKFSKTCGGRREATVAMTTMWHGSGDDGTTCHRGEPWQSRRERGG